MFELGRRGDVQITERKYGSDGLGAIGALARLSYLNRDAKGQ